MTNTATLNTSNKNTNNHVREWERKSERQRERKWARDRCVRERKQTERKRETDKHGEVGKKEKYQAAVITERLDAVLVPHKRCFSMWQEWNTEVPTPPGGSRSHPAQDDTDLAQSLLPRWFWWGSCLCTLSVFPCHHESSEVLYHRLLLLACWAVCVCVCVCVCYFVFVVERGDGVEDWHWQAHDILLYYSL